MDCDQDENLTGTLLLIVLVLDCDRQVLHCWCVLDNPLVSE